MELRKIIPPHHGKLKGFGVCLLSLADFTDVHGLLPF